MGSCCSCVVKPTPEPTYDRKEIKTLFPVINTVGTLKNYIKYARMNNHYDLIKEDFMDKNIINSAGMLNTGPDSPFNVFARYANGTMVNNTVDQSYLGQYADTFMICHNLVENDLNWYNPEFSSASMAGPDDNGPGHVFMTTKDLNFGTFNILTIIIENNAEIVSLMYDAANTYASRRGWKNPGYYFHCYPHNSVQSLHLHIVNEDTVGPAFYTQKYKNINIMDVIIAMQF
jgi:hypothetical protein